MVISGDQPFLEYVYFKIQYLQKQIGYSSFDLSDLLEVLILKKVSSLFFVISTFTNQNMLRN